MANTASIQPCGCSVHQVNGQVTRIDLCLDHGMFTVVQRGWRVLRDGIDEAHRQLPPGPPRAA